MTAISSEPTPPTTSPEFEPPEPETNFFGAQQPFEIVESTHAQGISSIFRPEQETFPLNGFSVSPPRRSPQDSPRLGTSPVRLVLPDPVPLLRNRLGLRKIDLLPINSTELTEGKTPCEKNAQCIGLSMAISGAFILLGSFLCAVSAPGCSPALSNTSLCAGGWTATGVVTAGAARISMVKQCDPERKRRAQELYNRIINDVRDPLQAEAELTGELLLQVFPFLKRRHMTLMSTEQMTEVYQNNRALFESMLWDRPNHFTFSQLRYWKDVLAGIRPVTYII